MANFIPVSYLYKKALDDKTRTVFGERNVPTLPNIRFSAGCCALWCPNCYYACLAVRMGESCLVGFGSVPGGHLAMRAAFRNRHGIAVSLLDFKLESQLTAQS